VQNSALRSPMTMARHSILLAALVAASSRANNSSATSKKKRCNLVLAFSKKALVPHSRHTTNFKNAHHILDAVLEDNLMSTRAKLIAISLSIILVTTGYSQQHSPQTSQDEVAEMEKAFTSAIKNQPTAASVGRTQSDVQSPVQRLDTRTVSVYAGLGFLELIALGVQYQINDEFALGVKTDVALVAGHDLPQGGMGGGLKGSYFFSRAGEGTFLSINVLNIEASVLPSVDLERRDAISLEATIGHDSIEGRGIGFLWLIGISRGGFPGEGDRPLIFPAVKIGFHVDL
jgi:hypothetical protein